MTDRERFATMRYEHRDRAVFRVPMPTWRDRGALGAGRRL
jgi:hypothetical protein